VPSLSEVYNDGERSVVPEETGWESTFQGMIYFQHLFAYRTALTHCVNKRVLEIGCGTGYGAQMLGEVAVSVTAIDVSRVAIEYAQQHHHATNVAFSCRTIQELLQKERFSFDVLIMFQTVEHVAPAELDSFMRSASEALNESGTALMTTPNRCRRLHFGEKPFNRYHFQEWTPLAFRRLCFRYYADVDVHGITGSTLVMDAEWHRGTRVTPSDYFLGPVYTAGARWVRRVARHMNSAVSRRTAANRESTLATSSIDPVPTVPEDVRPAWSAHRPFSVADFRLLQRPSWWCLDVFAECARPRRKGQST